MSPRTPLPARILIPVANPMTAEELIRLGASMLDRRTGELSALGIVEVPEGMPLSEGATRAPADRTGLFAGVMRMPTESATNTRTSASSSAPPSTRRDSMDT